ncbi:MAG: GWxTD domain-containing protein [Bacteroidetes bacterium]|nr:GWxTD domain-containing protein [Bacteroidota bacterium]
MFLTLEKFTGTAAAMFNTGNPLTFIFVAGVFIAGCYGSSKISNRNLAYLYRKEINPIHPKAVIYHLSDSASRIFLSIESKELLFRREYSAEEFTAEFNVTYKAYPSPEAQVIIDSGTIRVVHASELNMNSRELRQEKIIAMADLKLRRPVKCVLEISVTDLNRNQESSVYMTVDKESAFSRENFRVNSAVSGEPLFRNQITPGEAIAVKFPAMKQGKGIVYYYSRKFQLPHPPFSVHGSPPFEYRPDSVFSLDPDSQNMVYPRLVRPGFYHFIADTTQREGLTLYRFSDEFPQCTSPEQLLEAIRYFTTRQEYNELMLEAGKKKALDNFWLKIGGSQERARSLIKSYYSRVQDANELFTAHAEGWKTDRGMIYIIFGPPDAVYRSLNTESWVYGEEGSFLSFNFLFVKVKNPFSANDYQLQRSPVYKNTWYRAVEAWRQGVVY